jgi:signal transduction histidine kinase
VIEGFAAALARPDVSPAVDDVRTLAQRIVDAAHRMRRQLNDLLDIDRLSRRVIEVQRTPVDLRDLAVTTVEALRLDDRVEVVGEPLVTDVDVAQVERILENLLANAVRHAPSARVWVHVEPSGDGGALLHVDDDGPGVDPDLRERIFDVFESGAPDTGGTGVGLSLVRRFAELHGGRAWVQERPGGGASFRVHLPGTSHDAGGGR